MKKEICHRNPEYFYQEFLRQRQNCKSNVQAYEATEEIHFEVIGRYRYTGFDCFKTYLNRRKKKQFININNS